MTRDRAAEICQYIKFMVDKDYYSEEVEEALDVAIKALEQESSCRNTRHVDLISRQDAIEAIKILRNTAWLGTNEDREKTEQAVEVVAEALDQDKIIYCKDCKFKRGLGYEGHYYCALEDRPNRNWSVVETNFCSWAGKEIREQSQNCVKCKYYTETEDDTGVHSQCRLESDTE